MVTSDFTILPLMEVSVKSGEGQLHKLNNYDFALSSIFSCKDFQ